MVGRTPATCPGRRWRRSAGAACSGRAGGPTHALAGARPAGGADRRDLSLFAVPLAQPGVSIEGFFPTIGLAACDVGELSLDTRVPADALLGATGMGLAYVTRLLQFERLSICAQLLSSARTALGLAA